MAAFPMVSNGLFVDYFGGKDVAQESSGENSYPVYGSGGCFGSSDTYLYDGSGVLLGRKGTIDKPRFIDEKFWLIDTAYFVRPRTEALDPKFFYYSSLFFPFHLITTNTARPSVTSADLSRQKIPLPDLDTQRRIADYLDKETAQIDTLTAELDGYVELLEKRNTQLVDHYISGEPVSLNLLSTYFDCVHTTPEPDEYGEFESVRTSSIRSGKFVQGQGITVSEETYKTRNRDISPEAGDLFFTREAPAGESCLVPESNTYCAGQRVVTIRPNREKILPSYLLWALNSSIAQDFFRLRSTGSTVGNIKMDTIGQVKIPVPEISEQRKIVKEIEKHLGRTDALIKECRELKEILLKRRQVLITDVVTGKVEV